MTTYRFATYRLEPEEHRLWRDGQEVRLPPKVFELLCVLAAQSGRLVSRSALLARAWPGSTVDDATLAVHVMTLRRSLPLDNDAVLIETVPGAGYRFVPDVAIEEPHTPAAPVATPAPAQASVAAPASRVVTPLRIAVAAIVLVVLAAGVWRLWPSMSPVIGSLAVMPFSTIGATSDQAYLEIGMADALISKLSEAGWPRVPSTATVRHFANRKTPPLDAGREMNVDAVLTGTLQRIDDRIRVTVQALRVADGTQVWSGRYHEQFTDIFALQDTITAQVVGSLALAHVTSPAGGGRRPTTSTEAYELYLRARELWAQRNGPNIRTAIAMYEQAIQIDPGFALAFAGIADAYATTASGLSAAVRYPKAKAAAEMAVKLDPDLAEAHLALGFERFKFEWKWEEAEREIRKAIALAPRHSFAYHQLGEVHKLLGKWDEALADFEKARELDPYLLHTRMDLQSMLLIRGRVPEARKLIEDGLVQDPESWEMRQGLAEVLAAEGREDDSIAEDLRSRLLAGQRAEEVDAMRAAYRVGGRRAYLLKENEFLEAQFAQGTDGRRGVASTLSKNFAHLGNAERALHWLEVAADRNEEGPAYIRYAFYDFVRNDARFKRVEARVAMPR